MIDLSQRFDDSPEDQLKVCGMLLVAGAVCFCCAVLAFGRSVWGVFPPWRT